MQSGQTTPVSGTDNNSIATNMQALGNLYSLQSVLQQLYTNIQIIESASQGQIITVTNVNLYALASQYYGDPTQWTTIANANGLNDPYVEATIDVIVGPDGAGDEIVFEGLGAVQQTVTLSITNLPYTQPGQYITAIYTMLPTDDTVILATQLSKQIPNSSVFGNSIMLPSIEADNLPITTANVTRYVQLTIPQQSGVASGGILNT